MKTRIIGTSTWLLIFGAAAILLIGAFARFDTSGGEHGNLSATATLPAVAPLEPGDAMEAAGGPALPANLTPGVDEIIKLAQAHVGDDVILTFVQNSGRIYNPTADEILYLTDLGLSQKVIEALYAHTPPDAAATTAGATSPPPPPPGFEPAPPSSELAVRTVSVSPESGLSTGQGRDGLISPPPVAAVESQSLQDPTTSYFYDGLAPYGSWVDLGQEGWFWQPTVVTTVAGWQPYRDHGRWRYTDSGWYWQSDYSWGWAAFHYGRWLNHARFGWVWNPGQTWAPAWVAWRNTPEYAGWAPLPPGASFNLGTASMVNPGGLDLAFALSASSFTFVPYSYFTAAALAGYAAPAGNLAALFKASTPVNNYVVAANKILNLGVSAEQIAAATHKPVKQFALREVSSASSANNRMSGGALAVYRPAISDNAPRPTLISGDSRLSQPSGLEDPTVPARDVLAKADDVSPSRSDNRAEVELPRTPPPAAPGWSMRRFSLSSGVSRSSFPATRFPGRFASPGAGPWSRSAGFDEHRAGVPATEPAPPVFRGNEPWANRPSASENFSPGQRYDNSDARANQDRPSGAEPHVTATPATSSKK